MSGTQKQSGQPKALSGARHAVWIFRGGVVVCAAWIVWSVVVFDLQKLTGWTSWKTLSMAMYTEPHPSNYLQMWVVGPDGESEWTADPERITFLEAYVPARNIRSLARLIRTEKLARAAFDVEPDATRVVLRMDSIGYDTDLNQTVWSHARWDYWFEAGALRSSLETW